MGLATLWDLLLGVSKKSKSLKVKRCMLKLDHDECNGSLRCSCELKHCPKAEGCFLFLTKLRITVGLGGVK